jgi:cytochrome c oxidase cbb3-type subunit 3
MNEPRKDPRQDHLLEHDVDGIREYDNPMPRWWVWIFYATILYSVVYWLNVIPGVGEGKGRMANYERDVAAARELRAAEEASHPSPVSLSDEALTALSQDRARIAEGKKTFETTCSPCHRADGGGSIGPNLTDEYWIHGPRPTDMMRTVHQGVLDKGMPAWNEALSPVQIADVVAYAMTLRGTHPPEPKEPQGQKAEEREETGKAEEHDHSDHP